MAASTIDLWGTRSPHRWTDNYSTRDNHSMLGDSGMLERDMEGLVPLCDFKLTTRGPLLLDDFVIRRLSRGEIARVAERSNPLVAGKCEFGIQSRWKERIESMNSLNFNLSSMMLSTAVVPALRLFDAGDVTYPVLLWRMLGKGPNPLGFHGWAFSPAESPQFFGKPYLLTDQRSDAFKEFWSAMSPLHLSKSQKKGDIRLDIALRRFNASYWEKAIEDRFIDLMIGFEALIGDQGVEATNRLINRLCLLLGQDDAERISMRWFLKKSYDARSAILHGRRVAEAEVMKEAHMTFRTMVFESQRLLAKAIKTCMLTIPMHRNRRDVLTSYLDASMISEEARVALFDQLKSVRHLVFTDAHSFSISHEKS